jgi:hypothetical protein
MRRKLFGWLPLPVSFALLVLLVPLIAFVYALRTLFRRRMLLVATLAVLLVGAGGVWSGYAVWHSRFNKFDQQLAAEGLVASISTFALACVAGVVSLVALGLSLRRPALVLVFTPGRGALTHRAAIERELTSPPDLLCVEVKAASEGETGASEPDKHVNSAWMSSFWFDIQLKNKGDASARNVMVQLTLPQPFATLKPSEPEIWRWVAIGTFQWDGGLNFVVHPGFWRQAPRFSVDAQWIPPAEDGLIIGWGKSVADGASVEINPIPVRIVVITD